MLRRILLGFVTLVVLSTAVEASGRPPGCPHRFCGCALSIKVFGHSVRELWLAANWFRFPRTTPAPGMVAVRRGHVFQLQSHVSGNTWVVWDPNSGRGRIRVHNRSIAGHTIVNPRFTQIAKMGGKRGSSPSVSMRSPRKGHDQVASWQARD